MTLPGYWLLWGTILAFGHTVLCLLLAAVLVELLLFGFHKVSFTCVYVPGRTNFKLLGRPAMKASLGWIGAGRRASPGTALPETVLPLQEVCFQGLDRAFSAPSDPSPFFEPHLEQQAPPLRLDRRAYIVYIHM